MRRGTMGFLLVVFGGAIALTGIGMALRKLLGLYAGVLADPLGQPDGGEKAVSGHMLFWAGIGAVGAVPLAIGSAILWAAFFRRLARPARPGTQAPPPGRPSAPPELPPTDGKRS